MLRLSRLTLALACGALVAVWPVAAQSPGDVPPPPSLRAPANAVPVDPWPRDMTLSNAKAVIYQPQVESWSGNELRFRVAIQLHPNGAKTPTFGVVSGTARTSVDRASRLVDLDDFGVFGVRFPTLPDNGRAYTHELTRAVSSALATISLNRLEASLAAADTVKPAAQPVDNTPPEVIVSYGPAILVPIDGKPVIKDIPQTRFKRVINTQAFIARTDFIETYYLHVYDGWMSSSSVTGPWTQATPPFGLDGVAQKLAKAGHADLLEGSPHAEPKPSLANGAPAVYVTEKPAELIVFKGEPNFVPLPSTNLLWASNTAADVFVETTSNDYYILIAGRWYKARAMSGPWTYVAANALPADFARIPKHGPASVVLASVAGTPEAKEALIANTIPQDATVSRVNGPKFVPSFDGAPQYRPIAGTPLQYVVNSRIPIIVLNPTSYYAVAGGVWFHATSLTGTWEVATFVPTVVYTIPVTSPLHYVTYVRIYGYTSQVVYVGYTPGYLGTVVSPDGVVVYGTGYVYSPWIGTVWYPPPPTWGVAAAPVYNPAVGFAFGFGMGLATAAWITPYWGGAYYHPYYYGYPCCGSVSANVYRNWGTGVSSGTRTWYSNSDGTFGTYGSGTYSTARGTSGSYSGGRSYNPYTGQAQRGYTRTFNTAGGTTGSVTRNQSYNAYTGQGAYSSSASATGKDGGSATRNVSDSTGPQGDSRTVSTSATGKEGSTFDRSVSDSDGSRDSSTTVYNARTGETHSWSNGQPTGNDHYGSSDGSVYRNSGSGWQQHTASGWQSASGDTSWANREQQARSAGESRESAFGSGAGGWDRSGSGSDSFASRFGGGDSGSRFGSGDFGSRFGGGDFGSRFGSSGFADRFGGGGGFGSRFGGGGGRFGGFRR